jgi:hypothetical protein
LGSASGGVCAPQAASGGVPAAEPEGGRGAEAMLAANQAAVAKVARDTAPAQRARRRRRKAEALASRVDLASSLMVVAQVSATARHRPLWEAMAAPVQVGSLRLRRT